MTRIDIQFECWIFLAQVISSGVGKEVTLVMPCTSALTKGCMAVQVVRNTLPWCSPIHWHWRGAEPVEGVCRYKRGEKGSRQAVEQTKKLKIGHNRHTSRLKVRERLRTSPYRRRQVKQGIMLILLLYFCIDSNSTVKECRLYLFYWVIWLFFCLMWQVFCDYSLFLDC